MADDMNEALGIPAPQPAVPIGSIQFRRAAKLAHRYKGSYDLAELLGKLGRAIQIIGFILGGLAVIGGLIAAIEQASENEPTSGLGIFFLVALYAAIIVFLLYVYGAVAQGIGKLILATCDGAVYNSTFLSDDERASILSLDD